MENLKSNQKSKKWYNNKTTIVLLLFFLYPIGLIGLFLRSKTKLWKKLVALIPSFFLLLILIGSLLPPSVFYEKGVNEINSKKYLSAYNYFLQIKDYDDNYNKSQQKLKEIEPLAKKEADSILSIIEENYIKINQMLKAVELKNVKKIIAKTTKLYDSIECFYPKLKESSMYKNLYYIKTFKDDEIINLKDSLNSIDFICKTLDSLSNEQYNALVYDSVNFVIIDSSTINYILLLKLKDNSKLRNKFLEFQLNKITNDNTNEYIKHQINNLSTTQIKALQKGVLDTSFIKNNVLNTLLLSKMNSNNKDFITEYIKEKMIKQLNARKIARQNEINSQFSIWDGSHINLEKYVKENMNNPRSFKHIKTTYSDHNSYILVKMKFRGENAFGVSVINIIECKATIKGDKLYDIHTY